MLDHLLHTILKHSEDLYHHYVFKIQINFSVSSEKVNTKQKESNEISGTISAVCLCQLFHWILLQMDMLSSVAVNVSVQQFVGTDIYVHLVIIKTCSEEIYLCMVIM